YGPRHGACAPDPARARRHHRMRIRSRRGDPLYALLRARGARSGRMTAARILVVDDDSTLLRMLEQTLARAGYQVTTSPDAESALARIDEVEPEIVVTDLKLPAM